MGAGARGGPSVWAVGERCVGSKDLGVESLRTNPGRLRVVASKKGEPSLNAKFPLWCYLFASWYSLMKSATQIAQVM